MTKITWRGVLYIASALCGSTGICALMTEGANAAPQVIGLGLIAITVLLYKTAGREKHKISSLDAIELKDVMRLISIADCAFEGMDQGQFLECRKALDHAINKVETLDLSDEISEILQNDIDTVAAQHRKIASNMKKLNKKIIAG